MKEDSDTASLEMKSLQNIPEKLWNTVLNKAP